MSKAQPIRPRMAVRSTLRFAVVASQFNLPHVKSLVDCAYAEINELEHGAPFHVTWVPGSFEIPLAVKLIAQQKRFDVIIALGVILQGETGHADLIAQSVTNSLQNLSLEFNVPIIHEVLLLKNEEQALARCQPGSELNRGVEAARAAVSAGRIIREILLKQS